MEGTGGLLGENDGTMTIGLEVDAYIELAGDMVKVLDTSRGADDRELKIPLNIVGAGAVGVGGLDDTNAKLLGQTSRADEIANKGGVEGGDAVAVEHKEACIRVNPPVNQAVGVAVERTGSDARDGLGNWRGPLLGLDKVGTGIEVENLGSQNIVVNDLTVEASHVGGDGLEKLRQLGTPNAIGAIDNQLALDLLASKSADKGVGELVVVAGLADLAIGFGGALSIDAAGKIVELGSGEDLVVGVVGVGGFKGVGERRDKGVAGRTSVAAVDNTSRGAQVDLELGGEGLVSVEQLLVRLAVDELGGISLPMLLQHFAHGVDNLDAVVGGRVVTGRNHDTDGLAIELAATQAREKTDTESDAVKQVCLHAEPRSAVLVDMACDDRVLGRSLEEFGVHD